MTFTLVGSMVPPDLSSVYSQESARVRMVSSAVTNCCSSCAAVWLPGVTWKWHMFAGFTVSFGSHGWFGAPPASASAPMNVGS